MWGIPEKNVLAFFILFSFLNSLEWEECIVQKKKEALSKVHFFALKFILLSFSQMTTKYCEMLFVLLFYMLFQIVMTNCTSNYELKRGGTGQCASLCQIVGNVKFQLQWMWMFADLLLHSSYCKVAAWSREESRKCTKRLTVYCPVCPESCNKLRLDGWDFWKKKSNTSKAVFSWSWDLESNLVWWVG